MDTFRIVKAKGQKQDQSKLLNHINTYNFRSFKQAIFDSLTQMLTFFMHGKR